MLRPATSPHRAAQMWHATIAVPNRYPRSYGWIKRVSVASAIIVAAVVIALYLTPRVTTPLFGQTVEVGSARPTLSMSGPGQADLFGEGTLSTQQTFVGPVRPLIVWQHFNRNDAAGQFIQSRIESGRRIITTNTTEVGTVLTQAWVQYFEHLIVMSGVAAVLLYLLGLGVVAMLNPKETQGPRRRRWGFLLTVVALSMITTGSCVALSAKSAQDQLGSVDTLADLVGSAKFAPVPTEVGPKQSGPVIVQLGDSTAAAIGNAPIAKPTADDRACYRSTDASVLQLGRFTGLPVLNLACSGATIRNGVLGTQVEANHELAPQLGVLKSITTIKTVILNIGANDINWSDSLRACYGLNSCNDNGIETLFLGQLDAFKVQYAQLLQQLSDLPASPTVIVNLYYDPFGDSFDCKALKDPTVTNGANTSYGFGPDEGKKNQAQKIATKIDPLRANLALLNQVLAEGAKNFGFLVATPSFAGHALCSDQPWIQGMDGYAPYHPTAAGELQIALADLLVLPKNEATAPVSANASEPSFASTHSS